MEENTNVNVGSAENQEQTNNEQKEDILQFTREELDKLIQSKTDQRLAQALKTVERKNAEKVKQAEKLAKMSESEKFQFELEQREKAIAEKEHQLALAENKTEASKILAEKGLSVALVDFVVAEDAETMMENIKLLDDEFKKCVKNEIEHRLQTTTPKKNLPVEMTKESFQKLSIVERTQLLRNNPELYNKLKGV